MAFTDSPRKDTYLRIDGKLYYVLDRALKTQGRQGGLIILKLKSLDGGYNSEMTLKSGAKVEEVDTEMKEVQYLYADGEFGYFMDQETFETLNISLDILGDYISYLKEGEKILVMMFEGNVVNVKRKPTANLLVTEAADAVKGNTATNALKQATLETGLVVNVPMFVKTGDVVIINTETGEYSGRVTN